MLKRLRLYILLFLAAALLITAVLGPLLAPSDPYTLHLRNTNRPPSRTHIMGTDSLGRDIFSRFLHGARNSLALTTAMTLAVSLIGSVIGMASGYIGGFVNTVTMQIADSLLAFPAFVFAVAVAGILRPSIYHTVLALGIISWAKYARLTNGLVEEIRRSNYITQAKLGGARIPRLIAKYIMPNTLPYIVIMTTLDIGEMMITISTLSFIGLINPPPAPEWGNMIAESRNAMLLHPYKLFYPSLAIVFTVIVFNLLGDSLRDFLDPKDKGSS